MYVTAVHKPLVTSLVILFTGYSMYVSTYHRIQVENLGVDLEMTWGSCKEGRRRISKWKKELKVS